MIAIMDKVGCIGTPLQGRAGKVMLMAIGSFSPRFVSTDICKVSIQQREYKKVEVTQFERACQNENHALH